uniref:Uncharacterized protein n=1 Tax=Avena sativa TaxID=4498 RepID=A0ACD5V5J3_AVESA
MARDGGSGFHFCGIAIVVHGGSLSDRAPAANNPGGGRTGPPAREVVEISSDEEEEDDGSSPVARKLRFDEGGDQGATGGFDLTVGKKKRESCCGKEEDDCVMLDSDPDGAVAVAEEKGSAGFDGSLDELLILQRKARLRAGTFLTRAIYVPYCPSYPLLTSSTVACVTVLFAMLQLHAFTGAQAIKCGPLPASHLDQHQVVLYPAMEPHGQQDIQREVLTLQSDPSFLSGQTVGALRASPLSRDGRGGDNAHTARATRPHTPYRQELHQRGEDEEYTSEDDEYTSRKAKVCVGNLHYDIVSEDLDELFGQAGFVEFSEVMYSRQTGQSRGFGFVTMSVKDADLAVKMFNGFKMHGRRLTVAALRVARAETPPFRLYVGKLPSQASDSWLEELFSEHGKVVEARVVKEHDGWTWRSRGFGFVRMATEEESYVAIEALDKQMMEGRPLRVEVAKEQLRQRFY